MPRAGPVLWVWGRAGCGGTGKIQDGWGARMGKIGFDNELYMKTQKEHILERIKGAQGKLYLEFGGKLFDDYHAARVLPALM